MRKVILLLLALFLSACDEKEMMSKFSSPEAEAYVMEQILRLKAHDYGAIEADASPQIKSSSLAETLQKMAAAIPVEEPLSTKVVGAITNKTEKAIFVNTTLELEYPGKWLLVNVATVTEGETKLIVGFNVSEQPASLSEQNQFRMMDKSPLHYAFLVAAVAALGTTIVALWLCVTSKLRVPKWRWMLFILVGLGNASINWTTGEWRANPAAILLFSAAAASPLYGPWTVSFSLPLGAVIFIYRRKSLAAAVSGRADR